MLEWANDGGVYDSLFGDDSAPQAALPAVHAGDTTTAKWDSFKEMLWLGGSAWVSAFLLSGYSAYRHAKDPELGMPSFGIGPIEPGLDWWVALIGLGAAFFASDYLGATGTVIAIGAGLGALSVTGVHYGAAVGDAAARPYAKKIPGVTGVGSLASGADVPGNTPVMSVGAHKKDLGPDAQRVFDRYMAG